MNSQTIFETKENSTAHFHIIPVHLKLFLFSFTAIEADEESDDEAPTPEGTETSEPTDMQLNLYYAVDL